MEGAFRSVSPTETGGGGRGRGKKKSSELLHNSAGAFESAVKSDLEHPFGPALSRDLKFFMAVIKSGRARVTRNIEG